MDGDKGVFVEKIESDFINAKFEKAGVEHGLCGGVDKRGGEPCPTKGGKSLGEKRGASSFGEGVSEIDKHVSTNV